MKIKQHAVITNPAEFLKGDYSRCFALFGDQISVDGWIDCGQIEFDVTVDNRQVLDVVLTALEEKIKEEQLQHEQKMIQLEQMKKELLSLEHITD